jgi:tetratricopeptide (TPR) repeat protein
MASKNKKRARRHQVAAGSSLRQEVDRLIAKGRFKDAVKQGKLCYRQESTPEHHQLLERAYFLRADQLRQGGMPTAAQEVAQHLLDFGITEPTLLEEAARLLLALGMSKTALKLQERLDSPEAQERFTRQAADQAVLHPERAQELVPEIRQEASQIRAALAALEAGDEVNAMAALRDVARSSPLSEWKLFVRGLAAFSRAELEEARANWDRLDSHRVAARIARTLLALTGPAPGGVDEQPAGVRNVELLERLVFGEPVLAPLKQLRDLIAEDRWEEAIRLLGQLSFRLRRCDPALAERLTRVVYSLLIRAVTRLPYRQARTLVGNFTRVAVPLPIDPRWNRFWALIWEGPQGDFDEAEDYWRKYLDDLKTLPALAPEERPRAQALVWSHLGAIHVDEAEALGASPFGPRPSDREGAPARKRAVACLEESLRLDPKRRATYQALFDAYEEWGQPEQAAATARRLLAAFPDDFDSVMFLSDHHFKRNEPDPALEYAQRARALKPLDQAAVGEEWAARVLRARQLALKGRCDEGRVELETAERLSPEQSQAMLSQARKAVFELKAGQTERAESFIAAAQERLVEPTPLWLALWIEAIRYKLPKSDQERFEAHWVNAVSKRCRSETAGALADLMAAYVGDDISYPHRAEHVKQVVDYLRRTTRIKYYLEDLVRACTFLGLIPKERNLFLKLAQRGLKLFPGTPVFYTLSGSAELEKGPFGGNLPLARKHFEKALELAQKSSNPRDTALLPQIRESLSLLKDLTASPLGMPFAGFGGGPFAGFGMFGGLDFDPDDPFDDDWDDDDWDFADEIPIPPRPSRRPKPGRKRKKG